MLEDVPGAFVVAILLALTPAVLRWRWGRALVPLADDPALPERLAALNKRVSVVSGGCGALAIIGWPSYTFATLALLVVAQLVARFPLRRILYQETWTLGGYLAFFLRLMLGVYGLAIALVSAPWLASRAGRLDWAVAAGLAIALSVWHWYGDVILRRLVGARPIVDPALLDRFTALVSASGVPAPRFEYVPMHGGVMANAVAVPSLRGSGVLFTETLLQRFSTDETVGICAHELAHLEYYDAVRLRRRATAVYALIALTAALAPLNRLVFGSDGSIAFWIWPFVLFAGLVLRARRRQQNETASDLRAVALTGDPETLIRALTKLHVIARVPRRWDQAREREATHPSLARRIRDIRASVGAAPAPLAAPATFAATAGAGSVTFDAAQVDWIGDTGAKQALEYASLVELRLQASPGGALTLVAVDRGGRRWQMTPRADDVPAMQAVLDAVDGRLTHDAKPAARSWSPILTRAIAYIIVSVASLAGQFAFALVALMSVFIPSPRLLSAAGAAGLASTLLMFLSPGEGLFRVPFAIVCAGLAITCFALAWAKRGERPRGASVLVWVLALATVAAVAFAGIGGVDPVRLHQGVRSDPSAIVLLAALAGAAWGWRRRAERYASLAALTSAAAVFAVGTTAFLHAVGRDPFLIEAAPVTRTTMTGPPAWEFDAASQIATLKLSPHGVLAAAVREAYDEDSAADVPPRAFQIARAGQPLSQYDADDLVFLDDQRALIVARDRNVMELREIDVPSKAVVWRREVPLVRLPQLSWQAGAQRWTLLGKTEDGGFVRVAGTPGGHDLQQTTWPALKDGGRVWFSAQAARGGTLLGVQTQFEAGLLQPAIAMAPTPMIYRTAMFAGFQSHSAIWQLHDSLERVTARTVLDTTCSAGSFDDGRLVCAAFDGTDTRVVTIDPESASIAPVALIHGRFRLDNAAGDGWVAGWSTVTPVVLRLAARQVIEPPDAATHTVYKVTGADAAVATVAWSRTASRIRVYPQKQ